MNSTLFLPPTLDSLAVLLEGGLFALFNVIVGGLVWVPLTAAFIVYSSLFSLIQYPRCVSGGDDDEDVTLPCVLTSCYVACVFTLFFLAPAVYHFQLLRNDLVSVKASRVCVCLSVCVNDGRDVVVSERR